MWNATKAAFQTSGDKVSGAETARRQLEKESRTPTHPSSQQYKFQVEQKVKDQKIKLLKF